MMEAEGAAATAVPTLHDEFLQTLHDTVRRSQAVFLRAWPVPHQNKVCVVVENPAAAS